MTQVTHKTCCTSLSKVIRGVTQPALDDSVGLTLLQLNTLACLNEAIVLGDSNPLLDTVESAFVTHNACEAFAHIEELLEVIDELDSSGYVELTKIPANADSEFAYRKDYGIEVSLTEEAVLLFDKIGSYMHDALVVLDQPEQRESLSICAED